jgi:hypothetical protein
MDQIQSCLAQVLVDPHTLNIGKYGLIITKWCFETAEQVVSVLRQVVQNLTATFTGSYNSIIWTYTYEGIHEIQCCSNCL